MINNNIIVVLLIIFLLIILFAIETNETFKNFHHIQCTNDHDNIKTDFKINYKDYLKSKYKNFIIEKEKKYYYNVLPNEDNIIVTNDKNVFSQNYIDKVLNEKRENFFQPIIINENIIEKFENINV